MSDDKPTVHVEFFSRAIENERLSREENRPIFEDKEFVRIKFPGDTKRVHVAPAGENYRRDPGSNSWVSYKEDFPRHYELFKKGMEQIAVGTPISELPFLTEGKRAELRAINILTAEHLAGLEGPSLDRLGMGGRELKNKAQAYLDKASNGVSESRFIAENEALKQELASMRDMIQQMSQTRAPQPVVVPQEAGFSTWDDADLKTYIKEQTGAAPRGNPSHETLVRMAEEASNMETEAA